MVVQELKDCLVEGDVISYAWLPTRNIWTDVLAKEMELLEGLETVLLSNS